METTLALLLLIYKICGLLTGLGFAYLGYKLFLHGILIEGGHVELPFGNKKMLLKKAAPGIFFALFGAFIIVISLSRALTLETKTDHSTPAEKVQPLLPPKM